MAYVQLGVTLEDCQELSTRLREEDAKEILAIRPNSSLVDSLLESVKVSYKTFSVIEEGLGCIAVFGVRKSDSGGVPWMLTSELLFDKSCRKFIRHCKAYVKELTADFNLSYNYVSSTNTKAHRWLSWMGFKLHKTQALTINGVVFYPFTYLRNDYV